MSIEFDFYKTNGALAKKQPYHVRVVERSTVQTDELAQRIQNGTTLSIPDIKGTLSALTTEMVNQLTMGHRVHIEGLGYFSLAIDGEITTDKNNQLRLKNPSVRTIRFQPEEQLTQQFQNVSFTCQHHKGNTSNEHNEQSVKHVVDELIAQRGFFTPNEFFKAAQLTRSTGYRLLKELQKDKYIENIGTPGQLLLVKTQKNETHE